MPRAVALASDFDCWVFEPGDDAEYFAVGMGAESSDPFDMMPLLNDNYDAVDAIIRVGKICSRYRTNMLSEYFGQNAYKVKWEGFDCVVLNLHQHGSYAFGDALKDKDLCVSWVFNGKKYTVGLYSDNKDIDCGVLAKKYGGGGHLS